MKFKGSFAVSACLVVFLLGFCISSTSVAAQTEAPPIGAGDSGEDSAANAEGGQDADKAGPTQDDVDAAAVAGHNGFMLICCALVLFMTAPGLALFYGGLVRKKNVLGVMMQCIFLMGLMTTLWAMYGYSLAFGDGGRLNRYIGGDDYVFMNGVARTWNEQTNSVEEPMADNIPRLTHMLFQGMF
ncbi:MAG: ammonia channel protein, partial [Pirellulales bacterium]